MPELLQSVARDLGGLDLVVYSAGLMHRIAPDEYDTGKDRDMVEVNLLGAMTWLNPVVARFAALGRGTIVGIGSVAGDRGRCGNPAYGAAKAGLHAYLEALRNRVARRGVRVVTIKPGFVDTAMSRGLPQAVLADHGRPRGPDHPAQGPAGDGLGLRPRPLAARHVGHPLHPLRALPALDGVTVLPVDRLERVPGWGMAVDAAGYVYRPTTVDGLRAVLAAARHERVPVVPRGAGCSYGDAALRAESVVLEGTRMNRVLAWDPASGVVDVEPGVTVRQLWRFALGDGWWPPVVTGTMEPTLGGMLAMNVHGKNNWRRGTVGDHCLELDLLLASGELVTLRPTSQPELFGTEPDRFSAAIGSFGQLGLITRARLQLKRVHSGLLEVEAVAAPDLASLLDQVDRAKDAWEYVVGWLDGFAGGRGLGRGLLHFARHLEPGEDPSPAQSLRLESQDLPDTIAGAMPKAVLWRFLKPFTNRPGMRLVNLAKYRLGSTVGHGVRYRQSLAAFSFLLDYVPGWKQIYLPGGMIQHQSFVPAAAAERVFRRQLEACRRRRMPPFLAVLKRHRPDRFLVGHGVDGYSLALDFPVPPGRRDELWTLVREMAEPVVEAGGRFYPAKDAALPGELYRATFRSGELDRFLELKRQLDPACLFRSALADRLLDLGVR